MQVGFGLEGIYLGESGCCLADVEFAGHHIGDEAGAVFAQEVDLALGVGDGVVYVGGGLVEEAGDGGLFGEGGNCCKP